MKTKTLFATLAATVAVAAIAAPAAAQQPYGYDRGDQGRYEQGRYEQGRYEQGGYEQNREYRGHDYDRGDWRREWTSPRVQGAERRIDQGLRNGELTRGEHARLTAELRQYARLESIFRRDGMTYREQAELNDRFRVLTYHIKQAAYDRDRREYGYGYRR